MPNSGAFVLDRFLKSFLWKIELRTTKIYSIIPTYLEPQNLHHLTFTTILGSRYIRVRWLGRVLCAYVAHRRRVKKTLLFSRRKLQFLKRLIILVFHLTSLSLAVYLRPANVDAALLKWPEEVTDVGRTMSECITVIGVLGYILAQLGGEIINIGFLSFLKQLVRSGLVSYCTSLFYRPVRAGVRSRNPPLFRGSWWLADIWLRWRRGKDGSDFESFESRHEHQRLSKTGG